MLNPTASGREFFQNLVSNIKIGIDILHIIQIVQRFHHSYDFFCRFLIHGNFILRPQNEISVDEETAEKVIRMMEALDDLDDVQNVYANFDIADEILEKLSA